MANELKELSFNFTVRIVKLCMNLNDEKKEYVLSKQLLKSGTSIGANIREALNGNLILSLNLGWPQKNAMKHYIGWNYYKRQNLYNFIEFDSINPEVEKSFTNSKVNNHFN
jgi:hypothetical protein